MEIIRYVNRYSVDAFKAGRIDIRDLIFESIPNEENYNENSSFERSITIKITIPDFNK